MKAKLIILTLAIVIYSACVPQADGTGPDGGSKSLSTGELAERNHKCDLYLSFAISNYQNRDFRSTIDNYYHLLDMGCGKCNAKDIFQWMGRAFIELELMDSATYVFNQGLKYQPENTELLTIAAWNAGKQDKVENQIYYLDKILSLEEYNSEVLEELSDVYRDEGMYEEQVNILDAWLKYEPGNKKANAEKKAAYAALGRDESDVDKDRWLSDPSNIQYGLDYINTLQDAGNDELVIEVCNELLAYDRYNKRFLRGLGDAYLNMYKEDEALSTYESLAKVDPTDYTVAIDISKIMVNKEDYKEAFKWAETAISASGKKGEAIYQRGEVFFAVAEACTGDALTFWDKIVFEIAWQDYKEAVNKGYFRAKTRRDFLKTNNITTSSDWFMRPDNEMSVIPQGDCYTWINRSVSRR